MFFTGAGFGIISHLRTCLSSATYGDPGRVSSAADGDTFLDGQSKLTVPYIMVTVGNTTNEFISHTGQNPIVRLVERLDLYTVLSNKPDKVGKDAADQIHQVRLDLIKCLHGWNPSLAAECATPPVDFGYKSKLFFYVGDSFFTDDRERIVWEFNFELKSEFSACVQGFGPSNPIATEPFTHLHADFNPVDIDASELPFPQVHMPETPH